MHYAVGVKKERSIYNFCSESDFVTVSEWLSGVVRSSVVGSVPVLVITNRWTVLILSSYRYTSH